MVKRIKTERFGFTHYQAFCYSCDFAPAIRTKETPTPEDVRNAVRRHVRQTGHKVSIETGVSTHYTLEV